MKTQRITLIISILIIGMGSSAEPETPELPEPNPYTALPGTYQQTTQREALLRLTDLASTLDQKLNILGDTADEQTRAMQRELIRLRRDIDTALIKIRKANEPEWEKIKRNTLQLIQKAETRLNE